MNWNAPFRPAAYAGQALINAILFGSFPPGTNLPAERELAEQLGITRPTLRETLQRLGRDGWLVIQHGKPTRVSDDWREGGLNVFGALVRHASQLPADFVPNLQEVRLALAPSYSRRAVERGAAQVRDFLKQASTFVDTPDAFAAFDWRLHYTLTLTSANPIFTLILNGFAEPYPQMAESYFANQAARQASRDFYQALGEAVKAGNSNAAEQVVRQAMQASIQLWQEIIAYR